MSNFLIPKSAEELLAQCEIQTFRSSGCGGQHVNTTNSAIRLIHHPSGLRVSCQQERSQHQNRAICLEKLRTRLEHLQKKPKKRIPTRISAATRGRILEAKTRKGEKKRLRGKTAAEEWH